MRDPRNSLVIVPAKFTIGRPEGDTDSESQEAILVVTIGVDGGEIIGLVPCTSGTITDTKTLRNALKSEHCIDVMQQLSMPWVLGVMELLHFEIVRTIRGTMYILTSQENTFTKPQAVQPLLASSFQNTWHASSLFSDIQR